jgi:hypothetical protein
MDTHEESFSDFLQACSDGRTETLEEYCRSSPSFVQKSLTWMPTTKTLVERQLLRERGWFRDRKISTFAYGKGEYVVMGQKHVQRDVSLEKRFLYCTSGVRRTGLHEGS